MCSPAEIASKNLVAIHLNDLKKESEKINRFDWSYFFGQVGLSSSNKVDTSRIVPQIFKPKNLLLILQKVSRQNSNV